MAFEICAANAPASVLLMVTNFLMARSNRQAVTHVTLTIKVVFDKI